MSEIQSSQIPRETMVDPNAISDHAMGDLLNGISLEKKAIVLMGMQEGVEYGVTDTYQLVRGIIVGDDVADTISLPTALAYCRNMARVGLTDFSTKEKRTTSITEKGSEYGKPLAAALIRVSDRYDVPFESFLGTGQKRSKKATYIRYRLGQSLVSLAGSEGDMKAIELDALGVNDGYLARNHLLNMSEQDLVTITSNDKHAPKVHLTDDQHEMWAAVIRSIDEIKDADRRNELKASIPAILEDTGLITRAVNRNYHRSSRSQASSKKSRHQS